jgi:hypothetical protein
MKPPGLLGSIILVLCPVPVGILLFFYGMSEGFDGAGLWAKHVTNAGALVAAIGPFVIAMGLGVARRFSRSPAAKDSKGGEGKDSRATPEK